MKLCKPKIEIFACISFHLKDRFYFLVEENKLIRRIVDTDENAKLRFNTSLVPFCRGQGVSTVVVDYISKSVRNLLQLLRLLLMVFIEQVIE